MTNAQLTLLETDDLMHPNTGEPKWRFMMYDVTDTGIVTTASDLLFTGGREGYLQALDARTGTLLWKQNLGAQMLNNPMTYAVNGKQYVAVMSGEGLLSGGLITQAGISPARRHNEMYVFALPDQR